MGMDIGSVHARVAVVASDGALVHTDRERILSGPAPAVESLLERLAAVTDPARVAGAAATGSGRQLYGGQAGWSLHSSPHALIEGLGWDSCAPMTIVEVGGQSALVIGFSDESRSSWRVARSPLCAAGTGRFLEQQASRLGIPVDQFGRLALEWNLAPPRIAARCSVFAKSDLIHLQQKGWSVPSMLAGLSDSIARMIVGQWRDEFRGPVFCVGGVAANSGVVRALSQALRGVEVIVPVRHDLRPAIGAALLARTNPFPPGGLLPAGTDEGHPTFVAPRRLEPAFSCNGWAAPDGLGVAEVCVGVDVGSTSTKAVVLNTSGEVLAKSYLMTAGQPLEAVKQVMANLDRALGGKVRVLAAGATGSGRYLVGNFIGADLIKNEITAQTRAALQIAPDVTTIFELGGQDSKYVYLENGTVLDYQMNKACAAGTGSFIDELAEQLGVSTRNGEFARLAFESAGQLDLGEKCTAFMSQAVTAAQHSGVPLGTIVSSLSTSLAKNYLSKVVGTRRVGERVFLTGAVFYNDAVVSAFKAELPGKTLVVPEHKEVTGAIGAALLALESRPRGVESAFRGFATVAGTSYRLTNFNCKKCENSCAISVMNTSEGAKLYYGSRCDLFDAGTGAKAERGHTAFSERERLLFAGYGPAQDHQVVVGVPRALLSLDLAPMLSAFLQDLDIGFRYSEPTNKQIIESSLELAYTDSCFPIKLLHGHVAQLLGQGARFVLVPNAIRMAARQGDEDQKYACPLVQAAPYIVRSAFDLGERLLDPVIDLSRGDDAFIASFAEVAVRLGRDRARGKAAARAALDAQRRFEREAELAGQELLRKLESDPTSIGIVLLSRAYNAQDDGANLGMADELKKLGIVPIPPDFLPLGKVDVREISDRPYWNYERKLLAAAKLIAGHDQLFGLFLSNFGCGPNSIIQNIVEDLMGGKPLGQIELDEHAAEAGYITRLEALVDTIKAYRKAGLRLAGTPDRYVRRVPHSVRSGEHVLVVRMADHAEVVAAAMRSFGVNAQVLPESDETSMLLSRDVTNGKECLPFRDTLGVLLRMGREGSIPSGARALMAGSYGPCRLGKYAQEQQKILDDHGVAIEVMTTVSNNAYSDLGLGPRFELLAWQGIVATDHLLRLLWMTRPYERSLGAAEEVLGHYLPRLSATMEARAPIERLMKEAAAAFLDVPDWSLPRRPKVGINGEIYLRANRFCNQDLAKACEANGLEVEVAPMSEWMKYVTLRNQEDAWGNREWRRLLRGVIRNMALHRCENRIASWFDGTIHEREPGTEELLRASSSYLPSRNGSEAVLSLGSGLRQMADPHFAGVISVMPHGCMPGGIVAAFAERISKHYGKPWISLTYDGFADKVNPERIADMAAQLRYRQGGHHET